MAQIKNLVMDQGSEFSAVITLNGSDGAPFDFTGYTFASQMRKAPTSANSTAVFTVLCPDPTNGKLYLTLSGATTAAITPGRYLYDIITTSAESKPYRAIEGLITVTPAITR